ncbi:DEAD/DEAH box helicase [Candidatus Peregrinibacteria bacterium]|jgi:ATP-dependent RNA helicase DeaD|nr:DEAD/DEAH box helicase [Candidatus Peregrinibacteria bacterium]
MTTFKDLGLNPMILQAIAEIGFETPTPIQSATIPHLINSSDDLIALAQTGTGKTAAFALPIIQQLDDRQRDVQSLILCPTRELAIQIAKDIEKFIKYSPGVSVVPVFGGSRIDTQIRALKKCPQIVVGTPGRVNDMIRRRILKVEEIKWLVLDEADEMLNMGFKEELDSILENMPDSKQVLLFSATMNNQIRRIASNYMKKPHDITVGDKNKGCDNVQHFYYMVHERDRYQALRRIADMNPDIHGIIFCRTRRETQQVADKLIQDHYSAEAIHGEISQEQRIHVMNRFREKKTQLLVATDVAARGIDVDKLTHIINYNLPESAEGYVHRSGRTGRANNMGISLVIVNMREKGKVRELERKIGKSFEKGRIPTGEDVCEKQLFSLIDKICKVEVNEAINKYIDVIAKKFEDMSREELIKKFVSEEFNRFLNHYQGSIDLNTRVGQDRNERSDRNERPGRRSDPSMLFARFNINIGRNLGLGVKELLEFLNNNKALRGVEIGNIDLKNDHTVFEVDQSYKAQVMSSFDDLEVDGTMVKISCEATGVRSTRDSGGRSSGRSGGGRPPRGRSEGRDGDRRSGGPRKSGGGYKGSDRKGGGGYKGGAPSRGRTGGAPRGHGGPRKKR